MSPSKTGLKLAAGLILVCAVGLSGLALTIGASHGAERPCFRHRPHTFGANDARGLLANLAGAAIISGGVVIAARLL